MKIFLLTILLALNANAVYISDFLGMNQATFESTGIPFYLNPTASSTGSLSSAASTALGASIIVKSSAGKLCGLSGYNSKTSSQFIQIHNSASVPAESSVPSYVFTVPPQSNFSIDFGEYCRYFSTGIVALNSSTAATKTVGASDTWFNAEYK